MKMVHLSAFRCDYSEKTKDMRRKEIHYLLNKKDDVYDVINMYGKFYLNTYHFHGTQRYYGLEFQISKDESKFVSKKLNQKVIPYYIQD